MGKHIIKTGQGVKKLNAIKNTIAKIALSLMTEKALIILVVLLFIMFSSMTNNYQTDSA